MINEVTYISIEPLDSVSEFMAWQKKYDKYRRKVAVKKAIMYLEHLTLEDCQDKFIRGREEYGGEFDASSIRGEIEMLGEAIDFQNYSDIEQFQIWKDDPSSFDEYASQYVL